MRTHFASYMGAGESEGVWDIGFHCCCSQSAVCAGSNRGRTASLVLEAVTTHVKTGITRETQHSEEPLLGKLEFSSL